MRAMRHRQPAATIVSFALVAPLVLFIIFGTMEMGRVLNAWLVITNEAREAARYGAVTFDSTKDWTQSTNQLAEQTAIRAFVHQRLNGVLDQTYLTREPDVDVCPVTPTSRCSSTPAGAAPSVQVTIYYRVPLVVPLISQVMPNPFPISARSTMRGE
jgi:Flp pilus assembly protein TadG